MKSLVLVVAVLFSCFAKADISGTMVIDPNNTGARLQIDEKRVDGELSKFFSEMQLPENGNSERKTKSFQMPNGRFSLFCEKSVSTSVPPSTSCTFLIKAGTNTANLTTYIDTLGAEKIATIGMDKKFSKELAGIFKINDEGQTFYSLKANDKITLKVAGSAWGSLIIEFFEQQ